MKHMINIIALIAIFGLDLFAQKYPQKLDNDICTDIIIGSFNCKGCAESDKDLPGDVREDVIEILQNFKYCKVLSRDKLTEIIKTGDEEEGIVSLNADSRKQLRELYQAQRILFGHLKIQSDGSLLVTLEISNLSTGNQDGYKRITVPANKYEVYDTRHPVIETGMVSMLLGSTEKQVVSQAPTEEPPKANEQVISVITLPQMNREFNAKGYYLLHEYSGKYMCTGGLENNSKFQTWGPIPPGHESRYRFKIKNSEVNGYYYLLHEYSGKYVCTGGLENNSVFHTWDPIPAGHEPRYRFKIFPSEVDGYYYILHEYSGKYLCTGGLENGSIFHTWGPIPKGHEPRYRFKIIEATTN
jgi:hypothetical protein